MSWRTVLKRFRRSLFRQPQDDADLDDEIRFHLTQEARLRAERGASMEDAKREARRAFGSVTSVKETTRAVWVPTALEQLLQDLRFGARILKTSPAVSATAIALIAIVIGGNTTVFSIAHGILRKPSPGVTASRLVTLTWIDERGWIEPFNTDLAYQNFRDHIRTFEQLLAWDADRATLIHESGSHAIRRSFVSANYFETLGVRFAKGRGFSEAETATSGRVAVISHEAWHIYFQGRDDVVGTAVRLNDEPTTIIGVVARPFRGAMLSEQADVWVPLGVYARTASATTRPIDLVSMIGRLSPGVSSSQAHAELSAIWSRVQASNPAVNQTLRLSLVPYSATAGGNSLVSQGGGMFLAIFSVVTLMTLLIVCANVANLLVARAVVRQRELALRQSLGASRARLVRALLAEGFALSTVAWCGACLFAWWTARIVTGYLVPRTQTVVALPDFTPDWTVVGYALVLAVLCTVACTVAPAIRACRQELIGSLKAGEQAVIRGRSKLTSGLVVVQLALSVLLVTSAGLAYRSLSLIGGFDSGFATDRLLLVTINTAASAVGPAANRILLERLSARLRELPGVEHVTYARQPPREFWRTIPVAVSGAQAQILKAEVNYVGPDYLQVFGLSAVAGRTLGSGDRARTALISRNLAEALWGGQSPIGRTLTVDRQEVEVVGVAPNAYFSGFRREPRDFVFLSAEEEPASPGETTLYVRYTGRLDVIGPAIRNQLLRADPRTPVVTIRSWEAQLSSDTWPVRLLTMLLVLFAGGSLFIAAVGQYAVVAFDMRRRVRELGLRIALGASSRQVIAKVLREGFSLTAIGLAMGFALSLVTAQVLKRALYGISPTDPLTYTGVFALLAIASLLACYLPARRASQINPITALRHE